MLKLCGFGVSNYYNKVKLALLEKGVPFEEELVWTSQKEAMLARSPMGKVPFIETPGGNLSESHAINEYLDDSYPEKPMFPADAYARGKVREMCVLIDLYLEWPARRLYPEAFFGGKISDETKEQVKKNLEKGVRALKQLAKWQPYICGSEMTYADFTAYVHLPLVTMSSKIIYGADMLESVPEVKPYLKMLKERPHFQRTDADRKKNQEEMAARSKA